MPIPNHPDDERLSALAAGDEDVTADTELVAHVESCDRCTELVGELRALRASLVELPDLAPSRPLRLLPPVAEPAAGAADRLGGWARRFFAPVVTAGAALALVGLVGTAAPAMPGMSGAGDALEAQQAEEPDMAGDGAGGEGTVDTFSGTDAPAAERDDGETTRLGGDEGPQSEDGRDELTTTDLPAERSPWPMVLFTGIALVAGAALLRWILVPRAG